MFVRVDRSLAVPREAKLCRRHLNPYRIKANLNGIAILVGITDNWLSNISHLKSLSGAKIYLETTEVMLAMAMRIVASVLDEDDVEAIRPWCVAEPRQSGITKQNST